MKKGLNYILIAIVIVGLFTPTDFLQAQGSGIVGTAISGIVGSAGRLVEPIFSYIFFLIQKITALFMGLAALILNYTIDVTIMDMARNVGSMTGINIAWRVIRDLMNIGFIFILIYEGVLLIIGKGNTSRIKSFIVGLVLASLLINFSLFFTKVIIDASNIVTIGVYNSILAAAPPASQGNAPGLSGVFQQSLGLQTFFTTISVGGDTGDYGNLVAHMMASVLFLVVGFVFLAMSVMLVIRYIVLITLLALSPIAYMGLALNGIKKYSDQWWDSLWGQVLFAPVYMIMTWIVIIIIRSPGFLGTGQVASSWSNLRNVLSGPDVAGSVGLLFNFALVIGLTIASLVISKGVATKGASQIGKLTAGATTLAGGVMLGGAARIGRNTIGRAGNAISNSEYLKEKEISGGFVTKNLARYSRSSGTKAATSSLDVRSTGAFEALSSSTGVKFGKGADAKKVNFQKDLENKAKAEAEYAKNLKPSDEAMDKIKEKTGHKDLENLEKRAKENQENNTKIIQELNDKGESLKGELTKAKEVNSGVTSEEIKTLEDKIKSTQERAKIEISKQAELKKIAEESTRRVKSSQEELDKIYKNRVENYAKSFESESKIIRYTKNAFKIPVSMVTGITPTSKGDNKEIARKIRGVLKEKKKPTAKAIKELFDVDVDTSDETATETTKPENPSSPIETDKTTT